MFIFVKNHPLDRYTLSFQELAENFFARSLQIVTKSELFWKLYVRRKYSSGQIECSFHYSARSLLVPSWKLFTQTWKLITNPWKIFTKACSSKCSPGHPKCSCSFCNRAEKFLPELRHFFTQNLKFFMKICLYHLCSSKMIISTSGRQFWQTCQNIPAGKPTFFRSQSDRKQDFKTF